MGTTAAVHYIRNAYDTTGKQLLGRQAAGEGFLKGLVQYGTSERLYCYAKTRQDFSEFCNLIHPWAKKPRPVRWLSANEPGGLAEPGTLYKPDPDIIELVWQRRFASQKAYSICGVTHTIATKAAMKVLGDLAIAPVQPWDAVICTSQAVKVAVERLLETWAEYLAQRTGGKAEAVLQLPVIPLGINCDAFATGSEAIAKRNSLRQKFGIAESDIVILFVGRLIFSAKAHPVPMYLAAERAARATGAKVHLIQAGWFDDAREEGDFKNSPQFFCPSVNMIFLDGRDREIRSDIWHAADIFTSLSDNVQETFGLTPIEAMAAGLPVVVSDWDGYQESVRHGIDGFKIPTVTPPPLSALDFAANYVTDTLNYSTYIGHVALATAVDVDACARAIADLIADRELRQRMGENGRDRAREVYDWKVIIAAYEQLWQELAEIRARSPEIAPAAADKPPYPLCDDPFRLFAHYSSDRLSEETVLGLGEMAAAEALQQIRSFRFTSYGPEKRIPLAAIDRIIAAIASEGPLSVGEIFSRFAEKTPKGSSYLYRTLVYLLKFDILRIEAR